ncbi:MAG: glutamate--cysteine ligase [Gammaproteobacteria bacterium]|nr:MAG: glutamate--cysteine ligase [Gammaproteobacteria bacterium]
MINALPRLTSGHFEPKKTIEAKISDRKAEIESWFRDQWQNTQAPFYASVDLRNAGIKLAPVDTNLFPAGFNNLHSSFDPLCIHAIQSALEKSAPQAKNILLIPENHTRNSFYFSNISKLQNLLTDAGYSVRLGSLSEEIKSSLQIDLITGGRLILEPIKRINKKIFTEDFDPCVILLNNDLSDGTPDIFHNLEQTIMPPTSLGWSLRTKSSHFSHYSQVAREFCNHFDIDPWLIDPMHTNCGEIDFLNRSGEECIERNVKYLLDAIQTKYNEYGIDKKPFAVVKADSGTYGMGIMAVTDPAEVTNLNRKQRKKMASAKGNLETSRVIIQEGVYSSEVVGDVGSVAEPVVYMIDHHVVGGFYRVHKDRKDNENLNAPGMHFEQLTFACEEDTKQCVCKQNSEQNRFYAYGVVARLALLAAAREIAEVS